MRPNETLSLDGEFEFSEVIEKGEIIALDMRVPVKSGYKIIGTSFDPGILSLVHFLTYDDDGEPRVQYMFKALADGTTDVLVKMQPVAGGDTEIYKRTTINVGEDDSLF